MLVSYSFEVLVHRRSCGAADEKANYDLKDLSSNPLKSTSVFHWYSEFEIDFVYM